MLHPVKLVVLIMLVFTFVVHTPQRAKAALTPLPKWWLSDAMCIHRYEGAWHDPDAPYYGGMQFDLKTWWANGGRRFATYPNVATAKEQLHVAYWTWRKRGWHPWPNTAHYCGLI